MDSVILFVLGAVIGSFLNVVGLRMNSGFGLGGRSHCPRCGKALNALELIPVVGFLALGGRCRDCKARISWQYPLIELFTGLVFATIWSLSSAPLLKVILLLVFSIYIVILIYDLRHKIIPDNLVYIAILASFVFRLISSGTALDWLIGPIFFAFFGLIWLLSSGRAMGFGDAKLSLSIGLLLGATAGISGIVLAFWIGASYGIIGIIFARLNPLLAKAKRITMKSEIPFAPFLVLGAWLSLIFSINILHAAFL